MLKSLRLLKKYNAKFSEIAIQASYDSVDSKLVKPWFPDKPLRCFESLKFKYKGNTYKNLLIQNKAAICEITIQASLSMYHICGKFLLILTVSICT